MIFTLGWAKEHLAKFVDHGACADNPATVDRINEAIMSILMIEDWEATVQRMRFVSSGNLIVLPAFAERIVACRFFQTTGRVWSKYYEFMDGGPLNLVQDASGVKSLQDLGDGFATMFPIPREVGNLRLIAFSTAASDRTKPLHVRGYTTDGKELHTSGALGMSVPVQQWRGGVEGTVDYDSLLSGLQYVSEVTSLVKQVTTGYITLLAYNPSTHETYHLAHYAPRETNPGFRRYMIRNSNYESGTEVTSLVKVRYMPASDDNDPLLVQNPPAIKAMLQALRANDAGDLAAKIQYTKDCLWWLQQQLKQTEPNGNEFTVEDDFGFGSIEEV